MSSLNDSHCTEKLMALAHQAYRGGDLDYSIQLLQQLISCEKDHVEALGLLGIIELQRQNYQSASRLLLRAAELKPEDADIHCNYGNAMQMTAQWDEALSAYERAIAHASDIAGYHINYAITLEKTGQIERAIAAYDAALNLEPDEPNVLADVGRLYLSKSNHEQANAYFERALQVQPKHAVALIGMGHIHSSYGAYTDAERCIAQVLIDEPNNLDALKVLGDVYHESDRYEEALAAYNKALSLQAESAADRSTLLRNMGHVCRILGRHEAAKSSYAAALALEPSDKLARHALAFAQLAEEDFNAGWPNYEVRLNPGMVGMSLPRHYNLPVWSGERDAKIFCWTEQGVGDEIMFAQFAKTAASMSSLCYLECDARLASLFSRSLPGVTVYAKPKDRNKLVELGRNPPAKETFGFHCAIGSLPGILGFNGEFSPPASYLLADEKRVNYYRDKYRNTPKDLVVGIAWKTSRKNSSIDGKIRTIDLNQFGPLLQSNQVIQFVSLQYGDTAEIAHVNHQFGVSIIQDEQVDAMVDLDELAAQVKSVDLVISIDNSTVHLAGALGVPTWVLLPAVADWRWFRDRNTSLWYQSLTLFRQQQLWQWDELITQLGERLKRWSASV